jgi:hypothetical protein
MISPLMEPKPKIYAGKPLGLVSFGTRAGPKKVCFCRSLAMEITRIEVRWRDLSQGGGRRPSRAGSIGAVLSAKPW